MSYCCPVCFTLMPRFSERHIPTSKHQLFLGIRTATCQVTNDLPELVQKRIIDEITNISMNTQKEMRQRIKGK